jgi:hypothetical protein
MCVCGALAITALGISFARFGQGEGVGVCAVTALAINDKI